MRFAEEVNGVLICMDAFQIYQSMPILAALPSEHDFQKIPHHLYSFIDPLENFSLPQYYQLACDRVLELLRSGITPIFVGGAGLYMKVLLDGFEESNAPENPEFRSRLREQFQREGGRVLHQILMNKNPQAAKKIHPNDQKRLIRALEVVEFSTGEKQRVNHLDQICPHWVKLFVNVERNELYNRIHCRVDRMISDGVEEEVRSLLGTGLNSSHTAYHAIGLKETSLYLQGKVSRAEWIENFKRNSCRFAKRQLTWFRSFKDLEEVPS